MTFEDRGIYSLTTNERSYKRSVNEDKPIV